MSLLNVASINTYRGSSHVLVDISLKVDLGEVIFLLGRNGAGKTTTIESIMGLVPPWTGSIKFKGVELVVEERNPFECVSIVSDISQLGIGLVPEGRRLFPNLSVRENLLIARRTGKRAKTTEKTWSEERIYELFPKLKDLRSKMAHHLSGGEKQMVTIARALMGNPELLLVDEPSEGLAPQVRDQLKETFLKLKAQGVSMVIAEQNLGFTKDLGDRVYVLENGSIKYSGKTKDFFDDKSIREKYLGI